MYMATFPAVGVDNGALWDNIRMRRPDMKVYHARALAKLCLYLSRLIQ